MNTDTESITVRLPQGMKEALERLAKREDLTVSQLVRRYFSSLATTRRVSAATDSAARRTTPIRKAGKKKGRAA